MKKEIREQLEGKISVGHEAEVTPITRKKIHTVDADTWPELTLTELYDQLSILEQRRIQLYEIGQGPMAQQIEAGIKRLNLIIKAKDDGMPRLM